MFFVLSRAWDKENILSPHKESNLRPSDSTLRCSTTEPQRHYGERNGNWNLRSKLRELIIRHATNSSYQSLYSSFVVFRQIWSSGVVKFNSRFAQLVTHQLVSAIRHFQGPKLYLKCVVILPISREKCIRKNTTQHVVQQRSCSPRTENSNEILHCVFSHATSPQSQHALVSPQ